MPKKKTLIQAEPVKGFNTESFSDLIVDTKANDRLADEGLAATSGMAPKPTLSQGIEAAWETETATFALFDYIGGKHRVPDPNFRITPEQFSEITKGVDPKYHGSLLSAMSQGELDDKLYQIRREQKHQKTLGAMGGTGVALSMGAAVLDPVGAAASFLSAPLAGSAKVSRAANIMRGAGAGAGTNMLLEGGLYAEQETRDPEDILWAGGLGSAFGSLGGYLSPNKMRHLEETLADGLEARQLDKIKKGEEEGATLTPEGEARLQELTTPPKGKVTDQVPQEETETALPKERDDVGEILGDAPEQGTYRAGDNITVEKEDGTVVSGRIKKYNEDTGVMVVVDADNTPHRIDINEVNVDEVMPNEGVFDPAGSIGSAQLVGTKLDSESAPAMMYFKIPGTNFKVPLRYDFYAIFARSEVPTFQKMGRLLLSNSVGEEGHYARGFNASEIATLEWNTQMGKFTTTAESAYEEFATSRGWNWAERKHNRKEFNREVTKALRTGDTSDPHISKVVSEIQKINSEILEKMRKYGVEGADEVVPDPKYIMRRFNHDKISILTKRFDDAEIHKLIAGAIRSVRSVDEKEATKIAKNYFDVVSGLPYADFGRMNMGEAGRARLRQLAEQQKVDPELLDEIVNLVLGKVDDTAKEGSSPRLKHRTVMDEEYTTTLTGKDGKQYQVSMSDLFENDVGKLMQLYTRQTGGLIGLAQMGIRKDADFERMMTEARFEATKSRVPQARFAKEEQWMRDMYSNILGRPMSNEVYGKKERLLKALRDWNFIRLMGQVGVAQISEVMAGMATAGTRAMALHMPAYRDVIRMAKLGQIDDELGRDFVNMGGFGTELKSQHSLGTDMDDVFHDPTLSRAENLLTEGRQAIAMVSGLAPVTNIMRQLTARMFAQKMLDQARGVAKLDIHKIRRLAWQGVSDENMDDLFADMKKFMQIDNDKNGKLEHIDWEGWQKANPETYDLFRMAIWRESRRVVQESTIGETAPWMHGVVGKVLTQFRGFMLVAHAKNTLNNVHHFDPEAGMVFMASMLGTTLAYIGQTSINYAGNEEKLDEMLTVKRIATAGFQRTGFSALLPTAIDTSLGIAGWEQQFRHGRVSNQASSAIQGIATYDLAVNKLGGTAKNLIQNFTTDDYMATQKDVSDGMSLLLPNVFGVRNFINSVSAEYPKYNTLRDYNSQ